MWYKITKEAGVKNVIVERSDKVSIMIGKLTLDIYEKLKADGYDVADYTLEWNFEIREDTAKELVAMTTMRMKKPIRNQRKVDTRKEENKKIDAMDVLLGLASYN